MGRSQTNWFRKINQCSGANTGADDKQAEMTHYWRQSPEPIQCNPLEWWQHHSLTYPSLSKHALKCLSILASSVPSERLFSHAGETMAQKNKSIARQAPFKVAFPAIWELN